MYLTMNRFRVVPEHAAAFEEMWKTRDSHLQQVAGFRHFSLLKGPVQDGAILYASHTIWADEASFVAWTRSEAFRASHKGVKPDMQMYLGPPDLECFEAVQVLGGL